MNAVLSAALGVYTATSNLKGAVRKRDWALVHSACERLIDMASALREILEDEPEVQNSQPVLMASERRGATLMRRRAEELLEAYGEQDALDLVRRIRTENPMGKLLDEHVRLGNSSTG